MLESSIESVAYVCRAEAQRLRQLVIELEGAEPRRLESILRNLSKTGDTLSAALARVSSYVDHIEAEEEDASPRPAPPVDEGLLEVAQLLNSAENGMCKVCGGIRHELGDQDRNHEPDDHAKNRALAAEAHGLRPQ